MVRRVAGCVAARDDAGTDPLDPDSLDARAGVVRAERKVEPRRAVRIVAREVVERARRPGLRIVVVDECHVDLRRTRVAACGERAELRYVLRAGRGAAAVDTDPEVERRRRRIGGRVDERDRDIALAVRGLHGGAVLVVRDDDAVCIPESDVDAVVREELVLVRELERRIRDPRRSRRGVHPFRVLALRVAVARAADGPQPEPVVAAEGALHPVRTALRRGGRVPAGVAVAVRPVVEIAPGRETRRDRRGRRRLGRVRRRVVRVVVAAVRRRDLPVVRPAARIRRRGVVPVVEEAPGCRRRGRRVRRGDRPVRVDGAKGLCRIPVARRRRRDDECRDRRRDDDPTCGRESPPGAGMDWATHKCLLSRSLARGSPPAPRSDHPRAACLGHADGGGGRRVPL